MIDHDLDTLHGLLERLAAHPDKSLAESFRDCRLELLRLIPEQLTEEQRHRIQQMDYRLQMVVSGHGYAGIDSEAIRCLASFGWPPPTNTQ